MGKQLSIKSVDDILDFILDYELPFNEYIKVLSAFNNDEVIIWTDAKEDKMKLIQEIEKYREHIDKNWSFPMFIGG